MFLLDYALACEISTERTIAFAGTKDKILTADGIIMFHLIRHSIKAAKSYSTILLIVSKINSFGS